MKTSQRKWAATVSKDSNDTQAQGWLTSLLRQTLLGPLNTSYLTGKQMCVLHLPAEGYVGRDLDKLNTHRSPLRMEFQRLALCARFEDCVVFLLNYE